MHEKSPHYVLIMDEKRNAILSVLCSFVKMMPMGMDIFIESCTRKGVPPEDILAFVGEFAEKEHEMGWCKSPNCKEKKHA